MTAGPRGNRQLAQPTQDTTLPWPIAVVWMVGHDRPPAAASSLRSLPTTILERRLRVASVKLRLHLASPPTWRSFVAWKSAIRSLTRRPFVRHAAGRQLFDCYGDLAELPARFEAVERLRDVVERVGAIDHLAHRRAVAEGWQVAELA